MTSEEKYVFVMRHEDRMAELNYPPKIVTEFRRSRAKFIGSNSIIPPGATIQVLKWPKL